MKSRLLSHPTLSFPSFKFPFSLHEEGEAGDLPPPFCESSGLTVSEDANHVYVEAAVPGMRSDEIEMTYENGILWIKAMKKEEAEDKKKNFYRKATNYFSYRVAIPAPVEEKQPEAKYRNGVLKVMFVKIKRKELKKIPIKSS